MFNSILNLNGVTVLNKNQQLGIKAGLLQECRLTFTYTHDGTTHTQSGLYSDGAAGSAEANDDCVAGIMSGVVSSCSYDCSYDGFGQ